MANVFLFARIFRNKMKILLVEDNVKMRRLLKSMVEKLPMKSSKRATARQPLSFIAPNVRTGC